MTSTAERSYTHMDKTGWGEGAWNDEPDKLQWIDEATGLDCLIVRGPFGALCGYVGVPPEHPWHGADYDDVPVDAHCGVNYADRCQENASEQEGICHVPAPGRPKDVWWFGFDCAHSMDLAPALIARERRTGFPALPPPSDARYRDLAYVRAECAKLAEQLAAVR